MDMHLVRDVALGVARQIEAAGYRSHDPYDLMGSWPVLWLRRRKSKALGALTSKTPGRRDRLVRAVLAPFYQTSVTAALYRRLFGIPAVQHPKTMGLMLQAYVGLRCAFGGDDHLSGAVRCAEWLIANSDQHGFGHFCWGLPWVWPSEVEIPAFGPQSTISAVNGHGFLDLFEQTGEERYLDVARSVCEFFLRCLHIDRTAPDRIAFSYTPFDRTHILNVNFHCASLLIRVARAAEVEEYLDTGLQACNFSISEQRPDGAWHYSSSLDGFVNAVDNTHTGDNIEYLGVIRSVMGADAFVYEEAYRKGIDYYLRHLLGDDGMPWYTDESPYPVESHSACQMLIALSVAAAAVPAALEGAERVALWVVEHMMNQSRSRMIYRIYEGGRTDRTYAISWGDSWLVKGLALLALARQARDGE